MQKLTYAESYDYNISYIVRENSARVKKSEQIQPRS